MANPQPTDPHLRVAHELLEEIIACDFTKRQLSIILMILRFSWGCHKKNAVIPRQRDFAIAGVLETHIKAELDWLVNAKVLQIEGDSYWFNKDYDQWRVSRTKGFDRDILTDLLTLNLQLGNGKLTKKVRTSYRKGKSDTPELASAKERKETTSTDISLLPIEIKEVVEVLFNVDNFSLELPKTVSLVLELLRDFTDLDVIEAVKGWAAYCLDHPLKKRSSPAQQLRNRLVNDRKWGKNPAKVNGESKFTQGKYGHMTATSAEDVQRLKEEQEERARMVEKAHGR
ncbi:hypothetical protein CMI37_13805 [Candidatus Pacearchaeota archaeon]|nr:hypothetical protein [Candidatus Pacearchaeota archaeon]|tara:strand:- start:369 stop:1223 length:855 start_codon:yes stop_codon:yes gene_type:complete